VLPAWEGRLLLVAKPEEFYEVPNIVKYLVEDTQKTGRWEARRAIAKLFREMGEPNSERIPKLVARLEKQAKDYRVTAVQIKEICTDIRLLMIVSPATAIVKSFCIGSPPLRQRL